MLIENSFEVAADPDRVFDFLQDANNVVTCMPGAELVENLGDDSYAGRVKIKVGPVTAVVRVEGKDTKGNGSAKATATMRVTPAGTGAAVALSTELSVSGKLAQFGRGVMADVSNKVVGEMADRVRAAIEATTAAEPPTADPVRASGVVWTVLAGIIRRLIARLRGRPVT